MAYINSGALSPGESYQLGEYTFSITVTPDPGEGTTGITARADKGEERARVSSEVTGTVESWYVAANSDTADVYVLSQSPELDTGPITIPFEYSTSSTHGNALNTWTYTGALETLAYHSKRDLYHIFASTTSGAVVTGQSTRGEHSTINLNNTYTYKGKTVYYASFYGRTWNEDITFASPDCGNGNIVSLTETNIKAIAWVMAYGDPGQLKKETLVARFAIDLHDAGGTGPSSPWHDPGDYDTGREPSDPHTTLNLSINGALSGRHNDPLGDTSYSYVPADKHAATVYGCGGDGGDGGGGGAGASTVIVRKFTTDRADSKQIAASAKRYGYGSGGGKGGKGAPGCILIYW